MGYHKRKIKKGIYGDVSKIQEEIEELLDALEQSNRIMALVELSDLVASMQGFLDKNFPGFTIDDLIIMAKATDSAFKEGIRK